GKLPAGRRGQSRDLDIGGRSPAVLDGYLQQDRTKLHVAAVVDEVLELSVDHRLDGSWAGGGGCVRRSEVDLREELPAAGRVLRERRNVGQAARRQARQRQVVSL